MIDVEAALAALSLRDKCFLVAGRTNWRTHAYPAAGVPELKMSDGPNGVRGEGHGSSGTPGVVVPSGITLGATWDPTLVGEIGDLLGTEARRKRAHVLLGPTVNLHRTPVGGRTFECYSEDPELSGALAVEYVRGVQAHDVGVTVKHFVCNDTEVERMRVDVLVDERPLRELYLRPFERTVKEAGAWGIMSSYNRLAGEHSAENHKLLTTILRDEWGFDGYVVSDWFGVHHTVEAAKAGLSLEMPAPIRVYGDHLVDAVERGDVTTDQVDALARDVLTILNRTKADERSPDEPEESVDDPAERALTRRAAIAGTVLLRNERVEALGRPVLPVPPEQLGSVAVIGPNAVIDRAMGGGSASLRPFHHRTLLDAVTDRLGSADVVYEPGVRTDRLTPVLTGSRLTTPDGEQGLRLEYVNGLNWDAEADLTDVTTSTMVRFFGTTTDGIDPRRFGARITGSFEAEVDGTHTIGVVTTGPVHVEVTPAGADTLVVVDDPESELPRSKEFFGYGSTEVTKHVELRAGQTVELSAHWKTGSRDGFAALRMGIRPPEPADLMDRAVAAATAADTAIVMVGTNDEWETEGFDRETIDLPGRQDELIERVVAANPNTVVIVNAGSPVRMDWAGQDHPHPAPAVLMPFFAGQEQAEALADIVVGVADPGGRLPVTIPARLADTPAYLHHTPDHDSAGNSTQRYGEGLFVGYRWYDAADIAPRFAFGHGLSFGTAKWGAPTASAATIGTDGRVEVSVPITATGTRDATVVVQGYVAPIEPSCVRPPKELRTWAKRVVAAGTTEDVTLSFGPDSFHRWDPATNAWVVEPGDYDLVLAAAADDERARVRVTIAA
ncbi:MAG: glycoside hydrolase family 3 protein [Ilumatobacteraceae bacterium]